MIRFFIFSSVFVAMLYGCANSQQADTTFDRHNRAIHLLDNWMRDPYIILAPDDWYYLSCTRLSHIEGGKQGIQVWRSRDLAADGLLFILPISSVPTLLSLKDPN